jgi:hypothetical protein
VAIPNHMAVAVLNFNMEHASRKLRRYALVNIKEI